LAWFQRGKAKVKKSAVTVLLALSLSWSAMAQGRGPSGYAGKTVVITGASCGFGRGVALALAQSGANVVLASRQQSVLDDLAKECGANALAVATDVADADQVRHLQEAAVARFGHIDVWINDAGVGAFGRFTDVPPADYQRMLDINLSGTINGSYYALSDFKKSGRGTLINVASMAGKLPVAYYAAYSASKSAVVSLDAALRAELKADGQKDIKVCTVNPIASDTLFWKHAANYTGKEMNPSPLCDPDIVVKAITRLVEKPKDEVNVGLIAHAVVAAHRLAPEFIESRYGAIVGKNQMAKASDMADGKMVGMPGTSGILYSGKGVTAVKKVPRRIVVDLTHVLWSDIPNFHMQKDAFQYGATFTIEKNGFSDGRFSMPLHFGTHVDAPCHFVDGAMSIDQIPAEKLILPAFVIDAGKECEADCDYMLTLEKVKDFERQGDITPGAAVLLHTGWAKRWADPLRYRNADANGTMHFPGFSAEAADYLLNTRGVAALGIDTLSIDPGNSKTYAVHGKALGKGIFMVENLDNLSLLPARGSTVFFGPLPIKGGSGGPARVLAEIDRVE